MAKNRMTKKRQTKKRRQKRVRSRVLGTSIKPRLSVFRSLTGLYVQLINDEEMRTVLSVNSKKDLKKGDAGAGDRKGKEAESYLIGKVLAEKAKKQGIEKIVFDRSGYKYHGRVKAIADGARDGGLVF